MISLQHIARQCTANQGGIIELLAALAEDIAFIPEAINQVIAQDIQFKTGKQFSKIEFTPLTAQYRETLNESEDGAFYELVFSFFIAKIRPEVTEALNNMKEQKFLLLFKDANRNYKLSGNLQEPLRFQFTSFIDPAHTGRNGYACTFFGQATSKAKVYTGSINNESWKRLTESGDTRITEDGNIRILN